MDRAPCPPRSQPRILPVSRPHMHQPTITCPDAQLCQLRPRVVSALSHAGGGEYSEKVAVSVARLSEARSPVATLVYSISPRIAMSRRSAPPPVATPAARSPPPRQRPPPWPPPTPPWHPPMPPLPPPGLPVGEVAWAGATRAWAEAMGPAGGKQVWYTNRGCSSLVTDNAGVCVHRSAHHMWPACGGPHLPSITAGSLAKGLAVGLAAANRT